MPADKLQNLLNPSNDGELGNIIKRAKRLGELTEVIAASLPEDERAAVVAANVREDGELVVICASSAWASRLRYQADTMLAAAKDAGVSASACRVRVSQG
ncbi:MAG: DUF721 domain-containing protein [Gammaproteobacteria bacterium]|nr:DUF721 domain-containing protein [Gammaproteobacteria bacterium]